LACIRKEELLILKTKALLGALAIVALAVFGLVGFRQMPDANAGSPQTLSGPNPSQQVAGLSSQVTLTFLSRVGTTNTIITAANTGAGGAPTVALVSTSCTAATITGNGTSALTIWDSGTNQPAAAGGPQSVTGVNPGPGCDGLGVAPTPTTVALSYTITVAVTCPAVTTATPINITPSSNATTQTAPGSVGGSMGGALPLLPGTATPGVVLTCVPNNPQGALAAGTIAIKKVDQFGQPLQASFSIQQGPFWVEVVRVNLGPNITYNPCATDGTTGLWPVGSLPVGSGTSCATLGVITPQVYNASTGSPSGLPAGQYRVVEVAGPNSYCTLVQVYNQNQSGSQALTLPYSGAMLTQPVTLNLPDAQQGDLLLTFVNSCVVPGGPSTATSQIAVVIGGSTPGLVNTSNIEIVPAPGSDDDARLDIRIRDAASIVIPNAHVTVLIDKGALALRRDVSSFPNSGYDVIEPVPGAVNFASPFAGDTCDQSTNGWWTQSAVTGPYSWPFLTSSRQQADGYTNSEGIISACVYVDTTLAPGTTPGKVNVQAIVESPTQGGLYNPGVNCITACNANPYYPLGNNLSLPNYLGVPNIVLTATITVVGPPASITVAAAPTTLNCGEKATITVTVKDSAGQNVSDRTRVELVTNFGGVIGGTTATLGPVGITGGQVYPVSSSSAETFNGVATAYLITSTDHVGPYEVVAAAGGSVMASNGYLAPWYNVVQGSGDLNSNGLPANVNPTNSSYFPWYNQGMLSYSPSSAPVNAQATVTCAIPGAPAAAIPAPIVTAPRTGQGPADAFAIRPPNTGDAGLATSSGSSSWTLVAGALMVIAISGAAVATVTRR